MEKKQNKSGYHVPLPSGYFRKEDEDEEKEEESDLIPTLALK